MRWLYPVTMVVLACSTHHGSDAGSVGNPSGPPPCNGSCSSTQYCDGKSCVDIQLQSACIAPKATVVLDALDNDDKAARDLGHAMSACNPNMTIDYVAASDAKNVLASDGRPLVGPGNLLITAGGSFAQPSVRFMEGMLTPVFSQSTSGGQRMQVIERANGNPLVDVAVSALTPTHDDFVVQLAHEPASGTLTLMVYGLYPAGTVAGVWYVQNVMMPKKETFSDRWFVFEWTDSDGMAGPTAADMFVKLGSGK